MGRAAGSEKSGHGAGLVIIVCGSLVTLVVGISGNIVANALPSWLSRWALPAFLVGSLVTVVIGVLVYRMDRRQARSGVAGELAGRDRLRLLDGVAGQAEDLLWFPPGDPPPLRLGLAPRAELVSSPRHHFAQRLRSDAGIDAGIVEAYEQAEGTLLVLGSPGSGKSRQLAELTAHLVALARKDSDAPVPVLVSLATWTPARGRLASWLVQELKERYDVPVPIGTAAVAGGHVQPMLDGLDESSDVAACVAAVNAFRDEHGLVPLVVCSRLVEYERCGPRLRLRGAVELSPPSPRDVRRYLGEAGVPAATIEALEEDMGELLGAPLTLGLIGRICRSGGEIELAESADRAQRWAPLFDAYVDRMLHRARDPGRDQRPGYEEADVRRWLGWLAGITRDRFRLDRLQPDSLPPDGYRAWERLGGWLTALWPAAVLGFGAGGLVYWGTDRLGLPGRTWWAVAVGLVVLIAIEVLAGSVPSALKPIVPVEVLRWKRDEAVVSAAALVALIVAMALLTGGIAGMAAWVDDRPVWSSVFSASTVGIVVTLAILFVLIAVVDMVEPGLAPAGREPNEGIRRSTRHAVSAAVAGAALVVALSSAAAAISVLDFEIGTVAFAAAGFALVVGLQFGAVATVKHYTLRALLVRCGCAPWRYVRFLDFCAERVLLRRVGGAYEFLHPMMRDHLAAGWPAVPAPVEGPVTP